MDASPPRTPQRAAKRKKRQPTRSRSINAAFDLWLERSMHQLYDPVAREPIPEELLNLIKDDRKK